MKERNAVTPLITALEDDDIELRASAARALGEIGDEAAVGPLIVLLGSNDLNVAEALRKLGQRRLVASFLDALRGRGGAIARLDRSPYRTEVIQAMIRCLETTDQYSTILFAMQALAGMRAMEALPNIQKRARGLRLLSSPAVKDVISQLRRLSALPRSAKERAVTDSLLRPADAPALSTQTLPRKPETL